MKTNRSRTTTTFATTTTASSSLLDAIIEATYVLEAERTHPAVPAVAVQTVVITETDRYVEFQLLDWTMELISCPGCGCYPCKPGHMNGHTEVWTPVAGDVVRVRI